MRAFLADVAWLLASFALWAAAFHPLDWWPLAWVAMVPAFVRLAAPRPGRRRLGLAWVVAQFLLHMALMGWAGVIAPPLVFLTPLLGIPFSWLTGFLLDRGVVRGRLSVAWFAPLAIVMVEVGRDQVLAGLSWASIGYSQWRWLDVVQLASVGRVHLVSLAVLLVSGGIAAAIVAVRARGPRAAVPRLLAAGIVLAAAAAGGHALRSRLLADVRVGPLAVGVQPNIPISRGHKRADVFAVHRGILDDFRVAHPDVRPDLLAYPETSIPPIREPDQTLATVIANTVVRDLVLADADQRTILGFVRARKIPEAERGGGRDDDADGYDETNVAWVASGREPTDAIYEKRGLAPFGEYVPMPRGWPGRGLVRGLCAKVLGSPPGLNPGDRGVVFDAASPSGPCRGSLTICFEMVFPRYFREGVRLGADFHVNVSNDAWFDGSSELELVDVAGMFRAVETGRALLRVSNSGISTLIGPDGARLAVVEDAAGRRTQVRGFLYGRIPLARGETPYVAWGDLPWIPAGLLLAAAFALATIRARRVSAAPSLVDKRDESPRIAPSIQPR